MKLTDATTRFLRSLYENGKRANTVSAYRLDLNRFCAFCVTEQGIDQVGEVSEDDLREFLALVGENKPAARVRALAALRSFWTFLVREGHAAINVPAAMDRAALVGPSANRVGDTPSEAVITAVLSKALPGSRDRAILELLALGLTPSEVGVITLDEVNLDEGWVLAGTNDAFQAGTPKRRVDLSASAWAALSTYVTQERQNWIKRPTSLLVVSVMGCRLGRGAVWKVMQASRAKAETPEATPTGLRQARAVSLIRQGWPVAYVQQQMGVCETTAKLYALAAARVTAEPTPEVAA